MKGLIVGSAKALLMYMARKYLASLMFDVLIEALEAGAKKTKTKIDDELVAKIKADKSNIIAVIKA